jgi:ABC-type Fe3+/spermidine/putrescine transport system ATPase subunit
VMVGIRARDIQVFPEKPSTVNNCFMGRVRSFSYKGDFITYRVDTALTEDQLIVTAPAERQLEGQVWLAFNTHRTHLFPPRETAGAP